MSDNIRHAALSLDSIPTLDDLGTQMGTIRRLELFLEKHGVNEKTRKDVLKPLRDVRKARNPTAHAIGTDAVDVSVIGEQAKQMERVTLTLEQLRRFLQHHPRNRQWTPDESLQGEYFHL